MSSRRANSPHPSPKPVLIICHKPTDMRGQREDISSAMKSHLPGRSQRPGWWLSCQSSPSVPRTLLCRATGSRPSESKSLFGGESSAVLGCTVTAPLAPGQRFPCVTRMVTHRQDCTKRFSCSLGAEGRALGGRRFPTPFTSSSRIKLRAVSRLWPLPLGFPRSLIFQVTPNPDHSV